MVFKEQNNCAEQVLMGETLPLMMKDKLVPLSYHGIPIKPALLWESGENGEWKHLLIGSSMLA